MRSFFLLLCWLLFAGTVLAGPAGQITGKVTFGNNIPLPKATVTLMQAGNILLKAVTDPQGRYRLGALPAGNYEVRISKPGYQSQRLVEVALKAGTMPLELNATLRPTGPWGGEELVSVYRPVAKPPKELRTRPGYSKADKRSIAMGSVTVAGARRSRTAVIESSASSGSRAAPAMTEKMAAPAYSAPADDFRPFRGSTYESYSRVAKDDLSEESAGDKGIAERKGGTEPLSPAPRAGLLTSGAVNDFSKWTLWQDIDKTDLSAYRAAWSFYPEHRYTVVLKSADGKPLCNARISAGRPGDKATVWEAVTDNTGKAELWGNMFRDGAAPAGLAATVRYGGQTYSIRDLKDFHKGANIINTRQGCAVPGKLDIAFIVDATGSMGDEISYLKEELKDILGKVRDSLPSLKVQTGCIFYRDKEDAYLTRISDLRSDFNQTLAFIRDNDADGGGDTPEAVESALQEALDNLHWREDAVARIAFLILDAPPHGDSATVQRMKELAYQYAKRGIRLVPVVCSGADKSTEYLMRCLALATNGTYLFLTDHSGVGGSHMAPTTDKFDVEYLNGLIYRVIYQASYMPPCNANEAIVADTTTVKQVIPTDSVRNDTVQTAQLQWRYYPNPTTGILHIEHLNTQGDLYICDIGGKVLLRYTAALAGTTTVDLGNYPAGVYFIRYQYRPDRWVDGKFVVVH